MGPECRRARSALPAIAAGGSVCTILWRLRGDGQVVTECDAISDARRVRRTHTRLGVDLAASVADCAAAERGDHRGHAHDRHG